MTPKKRIVDVFDFILQLYGYLTRMMGEKGRESDSKQPGNENEVYVLFQLK